MIGTYRYCQTEDNATYTDFTVNQEHVFKTLQQLQTFYQSVKSKISTINTYLRTPKAVDELKYTHTKPITMGFDKVLKQYRIKCAHVQQTRTVLKDLSSQQQRPYAPFLYCSSGL